MKEAARALGVAMGAGMLGVVLAPQLLFATVALWDGVLPPGLILPLAHAAYETGLWGVGLCAAWAAWKLAWLSMRALLVLQVAVPALVEAAFSLWVGRLPPGLGSGVGIAVRLSVAATMLTAAVLMTRPAHLRGSPP